MSKQTAVEFIEKNLSIKLTFGEIKKLLKQAKAKERIEKSKEYLKGFNDGKEFKKKLDELTFKSE